MVEAQQQKPLDPEVIFDAFRLLFDDLDSCDYLRKEWQGDYYEFEGFVASDWPDNWQGSKHYREASKTDKTLIDLGVNITYIGAFKDPDFHAGERNLVVHFKCSNPIDPF
tara:strand:- start:321 stop:650 length:330 start_codon:yes stop_codon:yes gene_type:complete